MKDKPERPEKAAKGSGATPPHSASRQRLEKEPFSRQFKISELPDQIPDTGFGVKITASPEECAALAEDFELPRISRIDAEFQIFRLTGGLLHVGGFVEADVTEVCVISLDLFNSTIKAGIDCDFAETSKPVTDNGRSNGIRVDPASALRFDGELDPPQPITGGKIDLGAIASEFLALNLDPYPKKPGVVFALSAETFEDTEKQSPFEVLRNLKDHK